MHCPSLTHSGVLQFRTTSDNTQLGLDSLQHWLRPRVGPWSTEKLVSHGPLENPWGNPRAVHHGRALQCILLGPHKPTQAHCQLLLRTATLTPLSAVLAPQRPGDISEGHALVYRICTESGHPKDAQQQCYELFVDYVRAVTEKYQDTEEHDAMVRGLKKVRQRLASPGRA
jgi:hypothetical protein